MSDVVKLSIVAGTDEQGSPAINLTVGARLAHARNQQELSVEQVAGQLKWSPRQISEIEAGHYSVFPDMLTVRGFVRTYAKILKIDSTPLLEELNNEFEKLPVKSIDRPKLDMPFPAGGMPWRHNSNPQKIIAGVFLILLCLLAAFVYRDALLKFERSIFPAKSEVEPAMTEPVSVNTINTAVPNTQDGNKEVGMAVVAAAPEVKSEQKDTAVLPQDMTAKNESTVQHDTSVAKPGNTVAQSQVQLTPDAATKDFLLIKFKQDSWLQIKRIDGSVLISHLYTAGSEESFAVTEPLNLVIGNAPGVEAKLRGQKLVLPAQAGSNVVNLSIK